MDMADEQRRAAVLDTAWSLFSERGFARTQMTAIAEACHISTATIYKLFPSKEELFTAAFKNALHRLSGLATAAMDLPDPVDALYIVARIYAQVLCQRVTRQLVRIQISQNTNSAGHGRAAGNALRDIVEGSFIPVLQRCARAGIIAEETVWRAHALIAGFIEHQTLMFGLVIDETKQAEFTGDDLANDAVRAALLTYGLQQVDLIAEPVRRSA
jgi:AcrR family transcriptional regulator